MINQQEYFQIIEQCRKFCQYHRIDDYMEFAHEIICGGRLEDATLESAMQKSLYDKPKLRIIYLGTSEDVIVCTQHKNNNRLTDYKYCYHCNQTLPIHEFSSLGNGKVSNICKAWDSEKNTKEGRSRKSHAKSRDALKDGYIIDILKKTGELVNTETIAAKKIELHKKRSQDSSRAAVQKRYREKQKALRKIS